MIGANANGTQLLYIVTVMKAHRGFTLFDVVITMAIAALVMGMAAPSFQEAVMDVRIRSVAKTLASAVTLAKLESLERGVSVAVCPVDGINTSKASVGATCVAGGQDLAVFTMHSSHSGDGTFRPIAGDRLIRFIDDWNKQGVRITHTLTSNDWEFWEFIGLTTLSSGATSLAVCDSRKADKGYLVLGGPNFTFLRPMSKDSLIEFVDWCELSGWS